ncbi:MAG: hypothetical protein ACLPWS_14110 [Rhodomicrobium sp.]
MILRILIIFAAVLGMAAGANAAEAPLKSKHGAVRKVPPYRHCCGEVYRYVYAEAWYGNEKVIAPVRRVGCCDQVRVPGGAWIECEFSCEITVRKMRLDFWQHQGAGYNTEVTPGYPRQDWYTNAWGFRTPYMF